MWSDRRSATIRDMATPALGRAIRHAWRLDPDFLTVNHGSFGATPDCVLAEQDTWRDRMEAQPTRFMSTVLPDALREAATGLGASTFAWIRHVAAPVLAPAIIGAMLLLFGNAFAAYATAYALVGAGVNLVPGVIQTLVSGNVLVNENGIGLALGVEMIGVIAVVMIGYAMLQRRAGRWLQ